MEIKNVYGVVLRVVKGSTLKGANLQGADLQEADFRGADLWAAKIQGADLKGADFEGADLQGADLIALPNDCGLFSDSEIMSLLLGSQSEPFVLLYRSRGKEMTMEIKNLGNLDGVDLVTVKSSCHGP